MDRGARNRRGPDSPAFPLDLRHAAIVLEAPRHAGPPALRHAWLGGAAQYFSFSTPAAAGFAYHRPAVYEFSHSVGAIPVPHHASPATLDRGRPRALGNFLSRLYAYRFAYLRHRLPARA